MKQIVSYRGDPILEIDGSGIQIRPGVTAELLAEALVEAVRVIQETNPLRTHREHGGDWEECVFCGGGYSGPQHLPSCVLGRLRTELRG